MRFEDWIGVSRRMAVITVMSNSSSLVLPVRYLEEKS